MPFSGASIYLDQQVGETSTAETHDDADDAGERVGECAHCGYRAVLPVEMEVHILAEHPNVRKIINKIILQKNDPNFEMSAKNLFFNNCRKSRLST